MKREVYGSQKAFAGDKKPSMLRRCVGHDYTGRQIYMITMVTAGRRPLFGQVVGKSDAQEGNADEAQKLSNVKVHFHNVLDELYAETGKKVIRSANEIRFSQVGEELTAYQLSSGEKQMLVILLTVLVEDSQPYVLFMDEPEVSLHVDWQEQLIDLIMDLNPNVQIILTTHSPAMILNGWIDRVTEVSEIEIDNKEVKKLRN